MIENAPKGDSQSNGLAETAVRTTENHTRTLKSALEQRIGAKITDTSNVMLWMVDWSAAVLRRTRVGLDGMTHVERARGHQSAELPCEFASGHCPTRAIVGDPCKLKFTDNAVILTNPAMMSQLVNDIHS